jgi:hypothetical protein
LRRRGDMGDEIIIVAIEIIYGGLIQIDLKNETKNEHYRAFIEPKDFFSMFGNAMQKNSDDFQKAFEAKYHNDDLAEPSNDGEE